MSLQDPIADMLTRIRNAGQRKHEKATVPASKHKAAILDVLKAEGYIASYVKSERDGHPVLEIELKYFDGKHVIEKLDRVSRSSLRQYAGKDNIPQVMKGLGCVIVTTSKGVMTDKQARELGLGGELICTIA